MENENKQGKQPNNNKPKGKFIVNMYWFYGIIAAVLIALNIFMNSDYTGYDDYIDVCGYKGFASIVSYAVSNHSKLQLLRYWWTNNPDSRNLADGTGKALAKQNLSSIYIKFNTKF